jgi:hypothetical protein
VKTPRRLVVLVFFLLLTLLIGMFFWPFILNEIIAPTSLAVWVLLRIFVLSIDQIYFWAAVIFIASFFLYRRLLPPAPPAFQYQDLQNSNATMRSLEYWFRLFTVIDRNVRDDRTLKRELAHLLLSLYTIKQHTSANFRIYDALQTGQIPLPEHIHALLFPEEPQGPRSFIKRLIQYIQETPRKWIRRWTGRETADHFRMIDEVLGFMETSLEIKNDE